MKLPKVVEVGPFRYRVTTSRARLDAASVAMLGNLCGHSDHLTLTLTVDPAAAADAAAEILWHEVMHALFEHTGVTASLSYDKAERLIRQLSPAIVDVLRRNPQLVKVLTAGAAAR